MMKREKRLNHSGLPPLHCQGHKCTAEPVKKKENNNNTNNTQTKHRGGVWRGRTSVDASSASASIQAPPATHPLSQPRSIVDLGDTPHHVTVHILLLCSMFHDNKVRRTAEVRLSSCFLGWKFQPLRAICLYVH